MRQLALFLAAVVCAALLSPSAASLLAQEPSIGIDAITTGNTATSLGAIDSCVAVASGATFDIDLFVRDVSSLGAWQIHLDTDPNIVQVVNRDVNLFLASAAGSNIFDASDKTPNSTGLYTLAAADTADPLAPDSGSGVLARVTLQATSAGVSPLRVAVRDLNEDGTLDRAPLLRDANADSIGDTNGDTYFDGPIENAQVAVGTSCADASSVNTSDNGDDGDDDVIWIVVAAAAAIVLVSLGGLAAVRLRRRRGV